MGNLFIRQCSVTVGTTRVNGLRVTFEVKKTLKPSPNQATIKIYNLSKSHRSIFEDNPDDAVQIDAGYASGTSTIFLGNGRTVYSEHNGADVITTITAGDGEQAMQKGRVNVAMRKGSTTAQVLDALVTALGVSPGNLPQAKAKLAAFGNMFSMGTVLYGNAAREFDRILRSCNYTWSIQNGALQVLPTRTALDGVAVLLSPATGLIGSPSLEGGKGKKKKAPVMNCACLMIPDIFPGRKIVLQSDSLSGQYVCDETTHSGDTHGTGADWKISIKAKDY